MLVTLEGLDGSGKTTVWEALQDVYPDATFTREPTDSWYGAAVERSIGDDDADPVAEFFLYMADHADHLERVVRPALADGGLVISDRFVDSRAAYQGATLEGTVRRPLEYVRGIHGPFSIDPDLTLYLDVDVETALGRSGGTDKFERREHLAAVRSNYERLLDVEPERFVRIDATRSPEEVVARAETVLRDRWDDESRQDGESRQVDESGEDDE